MVVAVQETILSSNVHVEANFTDNFWGRLDLPGLTFRSDDRIMLNHNSSPDFAIVQLREIQVLEGMLYAPDKREVSGMVQYCWVNKTSKFALYKYDAGGY